MRANITIFIDPRQEFDGRLNGFVWVLDYELPSAFVWLIVSLWVMSPVTGDGQLFIKPRLEPLIGQRCSGRRLIGGCWPLVSGYLCPEGKCQSKCVSTFHYQQTNDLQQPLSYVSTSHQAQGWREKRELPRSNVQFKQFTLQHYWWHDFISVREVSSANQMPGMGPGHQWQVRSYCMGRTTGEPVQRCTVRIFKIDDQSRFREH